MTKNTTTLDQAMAWHSQGKLEEAFRAYQSLLPNHPNHAHLHYLLGTLLYQVGNYENAIPLLTKAVNLNPNQVSYQNTLGASHLSLGQYEQAKYRFDNILKVTPKHPTALYNSAKCHIKCGNTYGAQKNLLKVKIRYPDMIDASIELGALYIQENKNELALETFLWLSEFVTNNHDICFYIATAYKRMSQLEEAKSWIKKAIRISSDKYGDHLILGKIYWLQKDFNQGLKSFQMAYDLDKKDEDTYVELAMAYSHFRNYSSACEILEKATNLYPKHYTIHCNLGTYHYLNGHFQNAKNYYSIANQLADNNETTPLFYLSLIELCKGNFEKGWSHHHLRPSVKELPFQILKNLNQLKPGHHLLAVGEQGLGDEILFSRFLQIIKKYQVKISYRTILKLKPLMERVNYIENVSLHDEPYQDKYDFAIFIADLPKLFECYTPQQFPPPIALTPQNILIEKLEERLQKIGPPPYIGLTWRAGVKDRNNFYKQLDLNQFSKTIQNIPATYLALQRLPEKNEIDQLSTIIGNTVHDFTSINDDLEQMLALLNLLDHYVCVSNTNTHLRGSLNLSSHVLVSFPSDYRWPEKYQQSPWYPFCHLYRQEAGFDWESATNQLNQDLKTLCRNC